MISFWERETLLQCDIAIVGGGIVGMSVAASWVERNPNLRISIFEKSALPYGASTRNAGFACFGSLTEVLSDMEIMGNDAARELVFNRWIGLQITRKRLGDKAIGFEPNGGFEVIRDKEKWALDRVEEVNSLVFDFLPNYIQPCDEKLIELGISSDGNQLVSMTDEGQVDTGKLIDALEKYITSLGVKIRCGVEVLSFQDSGNQVVLNMRDSVRGTFEVKASKMIVCTNAFAKDLISTAELYPGRGQVFVTQPIPNLKFRGNIHMDEGYYYLRNFGNRLIFGGARNRDFQKENTAEMALNQDIHSHLEDVLGNLLPDVPFEVDMRWTGIMAFGKTKQPIVESVSENVFVAVKMGGMGIALAGQIGEQIADALDA